MGRTLLVQVLRTSMELGGNAPFVVFADADLDVVVEAAMAAKLRNLGEACTAVNRFIVHESVADAFTSALVARVIGLVVGDPLAEGTDIGPMISDRARDKALNLVHRAVGAGATLACGGRAVDGPGWFLEPTVLAGVAHDNPVLDEELFSPVATITTFTDEDEALRLANATAMGLAGYVMTRDTSRALRMADELEVGMLGVNQGAISNAAAPFGGVKQSGLGREGAEQGIEEYLETVYLSLPR